MGLTPLCGAEAVKGFPNAGPHAAAEHLSWPKLVDVPCPEVSTSKRSDEGEDYSGTVAKVTATRGFVELAWPHALPILSATSSPFRTAAMSLSNEAPSQILESI